MTAETSDGRLEIGAHPSPPKLNPEGRSILNHPMETPDEFSICRP
jgi:hypothetical protein